MELFPGDQMVVEKNTDQVFIREYQAIQNGLRRISGKTKKRFTIRKKYLFYLGFTIMNGVSTENVETL